MRCHCTTPLLTHLSSLPFYSHCQVHIAYGHDGQKYAVKCQHEGLRESAAGDMAVITFLVYAVSRLFEGFDYNWLTREMNQNMPLELDFTVERGNMEKCARLMADMVASGDVAVPTSVPALSAQRVLTMSFEVHESGCPIPHPHTHSCAT